MQVTLPSGNTVDFRDTMWRGDSRAIRKGTKFVTGPDGSRVTDAAFIDELVGRIFTQMMVTWSWGPPTPKDCQGEDLAQRMIDTKLDGKDWIAVQMALQPWIEEILWMPTSGRTFVHAATGVTVTAATDADAAKLAVSPDFTPSAGTGPKSTPTAITSGESPAPDGQEGTTTPTQ